MAHHDQILVASSSITQVINDPAAATAMTREACEITSNFREMICRCGAGSTEGMVKLIGKAVFAKKCFTGVDNALTAGTKKGEVAKQIKTTKYPVMLKAANLYLGDPTTKNLNAFFLELVKNPETSPFRRDLFYRFLHVLKMHINGEGDTLIESAKLYQRDMRHSGRPIRHTKLIGTTLLVKGLEYDHAIILDADSLDAKDLYVAMTRGAKSLTIIFTGNPLPA